MPQLMPLNWMFSSLMLILIMMTACFIYSYSSMKVMLGNLSMFNKNSKKLWFW